MGELYHHGIKGQKWGIRRSLEELGYKHKEKKEKQFRKMKAQDTRIKNKYKKNPDDLNAFAKRASLAFRISYMDKNARATYTDNVMKGKNKTLETIKAVGKTYATDFAIGQAARVGSTFALAFLATPAAAVAWNTVGVGVSTGRSLKRTYDSLKDFERQKKKANK